MHAMMGTISGRADWFARLEAAGVPMFDDVEAMAECAALVARYPALRARARATNAGAVALSATNPGAVTLKGRGP
jgi:acetyltransferase